MKANNLLKIFVPALLLVSASAFGVAGVANSSHDLTGSAYGDGTADGTQICIYCHTPHNASAATDAPPIWNKATTSNGDYTPYSSTSFSQTGAVIIGAESLACLSCHDGTLAPGSMLNAAGLAGGAYSSAVLMAANGLVSTDLTNDHPVGFDYGLAQDADTTGLVLNAGSLPLYGTGGEQMECATCHDVHNALDLPGFLRITAASSTICTTCHNK